MMQQDPRAPQAAPGGLRYEYFRYHPSPPLVQLPGVFAGGWIWEETWTCLRGSGVSVLRLLDAFAVSERASQSIEAARTAVKALLDRIAPAATSCAATLWAGSLHWIWHRTTRIGWRH